MQKPTPDAPRNRLAPNKGPLRNRLLLPYVLLLAVALAWSAYWVIAKNQIASALQDWRTSEAANGRTLTCGTESLSGYPFRFEFRCSDLVWTDSRGGVSLTASETRTVALAYKPWHIIFEADAPGSLKDARGLTLNANWTSLRASAELSGGGPSAIAIVAEQPKIEGSGPMVLIPSVRAESLSIHMRPAQVAPKDDYQIALRVVDLAEAEASERWAISADGTVVQASALMLTGNPQIWQTAGGKIALEKATITDSNSSISGSGEITPSATGQWSGQALVGVVAKPPADPAAQPSYGQALFVAVSAGAEFFGRDETIDGQSVRAVDLTINDGNINLGGLPLGVLPRLF